MLSVLFSHNKITLFAKKYVIKLITLISMHNLKPLLSLHVHLKLKCKCTNASCVDTDPFHNYLSYKNFIDGLCILKIQ